MGSEEGGHIYDVDYAVYELAPDDLGDAARIAKMVERFCVRRLVRNIEVCFGGYSEDQRELWDIPEVVAFCVSFQKAYKGPPLANQGFFAAMADGSIRMGLPDD